MPKVNSVYSTENGGYSADIYKVAAGYRVDFTRKDKTYVYYCKSESDCYKAINNTIVTETMVEAMKRVTNGLTTK